MTTPQCAGTGQLAQPAMGRPICPVCRRTARAGLPKRYRAGLVVPTHPRREG